jgi:hypothetical protein
MNMTYLHRPHGQINTDLFARDSRAFKAAGIQHVAIAEMARFGIRAASDALDWRRRDILRIPHVGERTVEKITALIEMA